MIRNANERSVSPRLEHFDVLGKISWLWMHSSLHRSWTMALASEFILPAIVQKQYLLIEEQESPVAYCSWAWLDLDTELRYLDSPGSLPMNDWNRGDRLWIVDCIAPFGPQYMRLIQQGMQAKFPDRVARAIRVKTTNSKARVMEFMGADMVGAPGRACLSGYYQDILEAWSTNLQRARDLQPKGRQSS